MIQKKLDCLNLLIGDRACSIQDEVDPVEQLNGFILILSKKKLVDDKLYAKVNVFFSPSNIEQKTEKIKIKSVTTNDVGETLLYVSSSTSPDEDFCPIYLKISSESWLPYLTDLLNDCIEKSNFPKSLEPSVSIPLWINNTFNPSVFESYRPVANHFFQSF